MLVDNVTLIVKAGNGGDGAATLMRNGQTPKGGPDGGSGGNGGSVYFQGSTNVTDLRQFRFKKKIRAEDGIPGKKKNLFGKNAKDTIILVPLGTHITDIVAKRTFEIKNTETLVLLAQGGLGGRGNVEFKSAINQTPMFAEKGTIGQEKELFLELKLIAKVGLIGFPNAGKSSLLAKLTRAHPKIGDYPFTTLEPNIGMMGYHPIADIPGLIEGGSQGKGLGISFLKHIEKTRVLVHCIDVNQPDVLHAYKIIRDEFDRYNEKLLSKPEIVLLTKVDLADEIVVKNTVDLFKKKKKTVLPCSIYDEKSINVVKQKIEEVLKKQTQNSARV